MHLVTVNRYTIYTDAEAGTFSAWPFLGVGPRAVHINSQMGMLEIDLSSGEFNSATSFTGVMDLTLFQAKLTRRPLETSTFSPETSPFHFLDVNVW